LTVTPRAPALFVVAGVAVAAVAVLLAAADGAPYLSLEALSPWLVVYAIGLFAALFATPFALHRRIGGLLEADARWERALLWWGAIAIGALALGLLFGLPRASPPTRLRDRSAWSPASRRCWCWARSRSG
jgi:hypothetical protein